MEAAEIRNNQGVERILFASKKKVQKKRCEADGRKGNEKAAEGGRCTKVTMWDK
jgi:hypothetical protein